MSRNKTAFAVLLLVVLVPLASLARKKPLPSALQRVGVITAILYNTSLVRQSNPAVSVDNGTELAWTDTLRTDGNGRVRVRLDNSSNLSVGSDSELHIVTYDPQSHRAVVELSSGRLWINSSRVTNDQRIEVRTPGATVTASDPDFGVDASVPGQVRFFALKGRLRVTPNASEGNPIDCEPGETVMIKNGMLSRGPWPADEVQAATLRNTVDPEEPAPYSPFP